MRASAAPVSGRADPGPGWVRRLLTDCLAHRSVLYGALAVSIVATIIDITFPLLTRAALDDATAGRTQAIGMVAAAIAGLAVLRWAMQFGRRLLAGRLSLDVQHDLRVRLLRTAQTLDGRTQDRIATGQLVSRSISDLQAVQGLLGMAPMVLGALLQFVLAVSVMLWLSPTLAAITAAVAAAVAAVAFLSRRSLFAATWSAQQGAADIAQHVDETVTGVRVVKGFAQESRMTDRLTALSSRLYGRRLRAARINARFSPTLTTLPLLGLVAVIGLGGMLTLRGTVTVGTFLAFASYVTMLTTVARIVANMVVVAQLSQAAIERVYEVLDTVTALPDPPRPAPVPTGPLALRWDAVDFGHGPDRPVLTDLDLSVPAGSTVAVIGGSGSGKTSLVELVPRFYAPDAGRVLLIGANGTEVDVADTAAADLRAAVTIVFDEPFLISDTIAANIAAGDPEADAEAIAAAARAAEADRFIRALPDGYDTVIGERGLSLSGGQRQRIALARAFLADPRVLILDDATSALDAGTEARVFANLRRLRTDRTTVLITHRPATLSVADTVAVLDHGRIVAHGTVAELSADSARFRALTGVGAAADTPAPHTAPGPVAADTESSAAGDVDLFFPDAPPAPTADRAGGPGAPPAVGGRGGGGGGGGRGMAGALGSGPPSPQLQAAIDALPPAEDRPTDDPATLTAPDPDFRLRGMLRPVAGLLAVVIALLAADTLAGLSFPLITRRALDDGVSADRPSVLLVAVLIGIGVVAADWLIVATMTVLTARAGERVLFALRVRTYAHLQRLGLDYYEREMSGRIMTRMTTDVDALSTFLQTGLSTALVSLLTIVGVSSALLVTNTTLALVALSALIPLTVATVFFRRVSSAAYTTARERVSTVNADFQENIAGLRTVQAYLREDETALRFTERSWSYRQARMRAQIAVSIYFPGINMLADLALAAVMFVGARQVAAGTTSTGTLVAFVLFLGLLFGPVQQLSQVFDGYQQARVGLRRIADLLRTPADPQDPADPLPLPQPAPGQVECDRVGFAYAGATRAALADVDLTVPAGSSIALVGPTGAGKSTIVKLLARFYDPTAGAVRVDGVDVRRHRLTDHRSRLGVVPQEGHLFAGTVAENIAFGRPDADRAEIVAAAEAVGALTMIAGLPGSMNHPVGERGRGLSAGQRQLIALARAELVDPHLLLLDEATATLDPVTERAVLDAGRRLSRARTSVLVAHRLSTAERADVICVVEGGRIVEAGPPARLRTSNGPYARLVRAAESADPDAVSAAHGG